MASSALIGKLEADVEIKASPEQFHDMLANKLHHVPHVANDKVRRCDLHEGEWGKVGTVFDFHYFHDGKDRVAKEVVEAVDPDKNLVTFRVIDGDLMKEYKSFLLTLQALPKSEGSGSIVHWTFEYEKLHGGIGHPQTLLQLGLDVSKDIDAHLMTGKLEADVEIKASPEQFHDMFANKLHHVPHAANDKVRRCDLHEGEWGKVGTVFDFHYFHDGKDRVAKEVVEAVDPDKNLVTFRVIDGDLMKEYKSFLLTLQAWPKSKGSGSIVHWTFEYEKLHGGIDHPQTLLQLGLDLSKDIDAHLTQPK